MGVGVVDRQAVDLPQHAVGQDAVQVERYHDRHIRPDHAAHFGQQAAFGVEFALDSHGAVHREVHRVDAGCGLHRHRLQHFGAQALPSGSRQQPGRTGARANGEHGFQAFVAEHLERPPERGVEPLLGQHLAAALDVKVVITRLQRVKGGDLLHALGNQDAVFFLGHGFPCGVRQ